MGKTAVGLETSLQPAYRGHLALGVACVLFVIGSLALLRGSVLSVVKNFCLVFCRQRAQMKSRTPRPGSRGLSTPVILSQTELTAGRTVSHGKAELGFASS